MIALVLLLAQAPLPTVGDTIWIVRAVDVPPGAEVRAGPWQDDGDIELLGHPVVQREGNQAIVSYPAVAWTPGTLVVLVPGPIVIGADGVTDSLPVEARSIEVASVLPVGREPESLDVQPQAGLVSQRVTSPGLLILPILVAMLVLAPLVWWWRRRGPALEPLRMAAGKGTPPVGEWLEAGERRAVAAAAARALRTAITSRLPGIAPGLVTSRLVRVVGEQRASWPADEVGEVLRGLESAKFANLPPEELADLAERAHRLRRRIEEAA